MAKEWTSTCKMCGKDFGYSDASLKIRAASSGHSRPEYCAECRVIHNLERLYKGIGYFDLSKYLPVGTTKLSAPVFGAYDRQNRVHRANILDSRFDPNRIGITEDDVRRLFEYFSEPLNKIALLIGETGSGKSTALIMHLMMGIDGFRDNVFTKYGPIILTQPRIKPTLKISHFLGEVFVGSSVGQGYDIGYRHSKDRNMDNWNRLATVTDGTVLNWLVEGQVANIGLLVIDEAHELSKNITMTLMLLKRFQYRYPYLNTLIESATLNSDPILDYYEDRAKLFTVKGKRDGKYFVHYAKEEILPYHDEEQLKKRVVAEAAKLTIKLLHRTARGKAHYTADFLVFLPGAREIEECIDLINTEIAANHQLRRLIEGVYPLYGALPQDEMDRALAERQDLRRIRVFVATNIAETSLTFQKLRTIVETGVIKKNTFDDERMDTRLVLSRHSQSGCEQRFGRAGRIGYDDGFDDEVYTLYTEEQFDQFEKFTPSELENSELSDPILTLKAAGIDDIDWLFSPPTDRISSFTDMMTRSNVLDTDGNVTELGEQLRYYPGENYLANIMSDADSLGIALELSTLLPVIKPGGKQKLLRYIGRWDATTKYQIRKRHRSLMVGCRDDIDFVLKLYYLWELNETDEARAAWADVWYINEHVFSLDIKPERKQLLDFYSMKTKYAEPRGVDLRKARLVRCLLYAHYPENFIAYNESGKYEYNPKKEFVEESPILLHGRIDSEERNISLYFRPDTETPFSAFQQIHSLSYTKDKIHRMCGEQVYAVGSIVRYDIEAIGNQFNYQIIESLPPAPVQEQFFFGREEERDEEGLDGEHADFTSPISDIRVDMEMYLVPKQTTDHHMLAVVTGYDPNSEPHPQALTQPLVSINPLDYFKDLYDVGDTITVRVVDKDEWDLDRRAYLVVRELETGFEIVMDPTSVSFTSFKACVRAIPLDATFEVELSSIDTDTERVEVSLLPKLEADFDEVIRINQIRGGFATSGTVLDVYEIERTGRRYASYVLDISDPTSGLVYVVSAPGEGKQIGDRDNLWLGSRAETYMLLESLPEELAELMDQKQGFLSNLTYREKKLYIRGRMSASVRDHIIQSNPDESFHRIIHRLYAMSQELVSGAFLPIQESDKGKIIGKGGTIVKAMQAATGAKIEARDPGLVKVFGNHTQISEAIALIKDKVTTTEPPLLVVEGRQGVKVEKECYKTEFGGDLMNALTKEPKVSLLLKPVLQEPISNSHSYRLLMFNAMFSPLHNIQGRKGMAISTSRSLSTMSRRIDLIAFQFDYLIVKSGVLDQVSLDSFVQSIESQFIDTVIIRAMDEDNIAQIELSFSVDWKEFNRQMDAGNGSIDDTPEASGVHGLLEETATGVRVFDEILEENKLLPELLFRLNQDRFEPSESESHAMESPNIVASTVPDFEEYGNKVGSIDNSPELLPEFTITFNYLDKE